MNAILNTACVIAWFGLISARTVLDSNAKKEVVETPPPWALVTKPIEERIVRVGCFKDKFKPRALPNLIKNYRLSKSFDWSNMSAIVVGCAKTAKSRGHTWFAVQFYGECWSGPNSSITYDRYGPSESCWNGVGEHWANMVYMIE